MMVRSSERTSFTLPSVNGVVVAIQTLIVERYTFMRFIGEAPG